MLVFVRNKLVLGFYLLTKGGDWLSDHCSNLASSLGVPSVVIGLTIVSIAIGPGTLHLHRSLKK